MFKKFKKSTREYWVATLTKIAHPVLYFAAQDELKRNMPFECAPGGEKRKEFAYLEAVARTIYGIVPWLENTDITVEENETRLYYADLARRSITNLVTPSSNDYTQLSGGATQPLVDIAFLEQGILRAKKELWYKLDDATKENLLIYMKQTRDIRPWRNNWILFRSTVEVFLQEVAESGIKSIMDYLNLNNGMWGMVAIKTELM